MEWSDYESAVAESFRALGFDVSLRETVTGARGKHVLDVVARLTTASISQLWVVECKLWKSAVKKSAVLTFQQIVQDVGADRGFVFAEAGFQAGAVRGIDKTNITLASLDDFTENTAAERTKLLLFVLEARTENAISDLHALSGPSGNGSRRFYDPDHISTLGRLSTESALRAVRRGSERFSLAPPDSEAPVEVATWEDFVARTEKVLRHAEAYIQAWQARLAARRASPADQ